MFSDWVNHHDAAAANELINAYETADGPGDDNGFAVYLGVQCSDVHVADQLEHLEPRQLAIFSFAPFVTWGNAWFNAPCIYWPARASRPVNINGTRHPAARC